MPPAGRCHALKSRYPHPAPLLHSLERTCKRVKQGVPAMAVGRFVAYYRVSTDRQGKSGLGLEAQREAVQRYLDGGSWTLAAEVTEVESGKRNDRPELDRALGLVPLVRRDPGGRQA